MLGHQCHPAAVTVSNIRYYFELMQTSMYLLLKFITVLYSYSIYKSVSKMTVRIPCLQHF